MIFRRNVHFVESLLFDSCCDNVIQAEKIRLLITAGSTSSNLCMLAVAVDVEVTEGGEAAFIAASIENCRNSVKEPGVTRFDFMQNNDNPRNFLLFEVYNNANGPVEHKATGRSRL